MVIALTLACAAASKPKRATVKHPGIEHVRNIFYADAHAPGFWGTEGWGLRKVAGELKKSKCLHLVSSPKKADAILVAVTYKSWLDAAGDALSGCIVSGGTVLCNQGGAVESTQCDAGGCISGPISSKPKSEELIFVNPKTGRPMSRWALRIFWGARGKIERAVGCKEG